jgi:hypothetical protein
MSSGEPMVFGPSGVGDIDRVAHRRQLAVRTGLAIAGPHHVVDLFLQRALGVHPALDDLDAIEVAAFRVLHRGDEERRRLARALRP